MALIQGQAINQPLHAQKHLHSLPASNTRFCGDPFISVTAVSEIISKCYVFFRLHVLFLTQEE